MAFAEVAVDAPVGVGQTFSYRVPNGLDVAPGDAVWVPFGPRRRAGIVFELSALPKVSAVRDLESRVFSERLLELYQLHLARWISRYYLCSLFTALSPMLPPSFPPGQRSSGAGGPRYLEVLRTDMEADQVREQAATLRKARATKQAALLEHLIDSPEPRAATELRRLFGAATVRAIVNKGYASLVRVRREQDPPGEDRAQRVQPPVLTVDQSGAIEPIARGLSEESCRTFLLWGVTGSGKTEVYLQAIDRCLERHKRAIVLVPEIALTPQMVQQFTGRFPGRVAVLHSGLSEGQRRDRWWGVHDGRYDIVIGPRSALFAPVSSLGLIVIDEEHEWTYKEQDRAPRYQARETAIRLAEIVDAAVVLGSATPDVETMYHAERGTYELLQLPNRVSEETGAALPVADVQVVDMRRELSEGNRSIFSRPLQSSLEACLEAGQQAILFLNRRGSAASIQCRHCGFVLTCRRCSLPMTYHSAWELAVCHQCGRRTAPPATCPECRSHRIRFLGLGTQRVVEEVESRFPEARVLRWDRDAISNWREHQEITGRFQRREANVLVGTQMLAKGLHFPGVSLVGVLLADIGLHVPDFRSSERTFQVLCQVAGRSGRGRNPGAVFVQTYTPSHYAVRHAAAQDYLGFYREELEYRRALTAPPFSRLVRLMYQHTNYAQCSAQAQKLADTLRIARDVLGHVIDVVGPAPAYPPRVRGRYRWHILLRGADPTALLEGRELPGGWTVDVDPVSTV